MVRKIRFAFQVLAKINFTGLKNYLPWTKSLNLNKLKNSPKITKTWIRHIR